MRTHHRRPLAMAATIATALLGGGMLTAHPAAAATTDNANAAITDCAITSTRSDGMLDVDLLQACLGQVQSSFVSALDDMPEVEPAFAETPAETPASDAFDVVLPVLIETVAFEEPVAEPAAEESAPAYEGTGGSWAALRDCESGGDYGINTGNGYYGAYQFSLSTWQGLGYEGYPHEASPIVQDQAASELQSLYGWGQWPACSQYLGLG